jgi:predicted RNA-binding Zn-ribbon protein involved in translation (DUF1610 family)
MSKKVHVGCSECGRLFYADRLARVVPCPNCGTMCDVDSTGPGYEID